MSHPSITIIAEAGVNHNGSLEMARRMVRVAAEAGADLVKFQTFTAQALVSAAPPSIYCRFFDPSAILSGIF